MRCFIGLPMPQEYQQGLQGVAAAWQGRLRSGLSWTRPGNWHLTLKFLGEVHEESLDALIQILRHPMGDRFVMQAGGGGFFPGLSRPRGLWVGLRQGDDACRDLAREVAQRCEAIGFPIEQRPFASHLTIARIKQAKPDPWSQVLQSLHAAKWPETEMDRVVLWESRLGGQGPTFTALAEFALI